MNNAYRWITKIIDSCTDSFHIECCSTLINLFQSKYDNNYLTEKLLSLLAEKQSKLT